MNPAFSVIFLTTLIGAAQGLFIAIVAGRTFFSVIDVTFHFSAAVVCLVLLVLGLAASFFHLGRPERAWRAATQWKTSWLSREVIALPICMALVFAYGMLLYADTPASVEMSETVGWIGVAAMIVLFVCTAMIYACIRFLQEWASAWTLVNFTVLGLGSGFMLACVLVSFLDPASYGEYRAITIGLIVTGFVARAASMYRNSRIRHKSTIQSAIGIKHRSITQRSMGFTGGSFNTRAFFHHCSIRLIANLRIFVFIFAFVLPIGFLLLCDDVAMRNFLLWVIPVQYTGLVAERWLFFAQANHPQNIYYQTVG